MTASPVVTRFAPSPTGFLHIGGARTALFNWLFARHHGGRFLLRIEDTDRARHSQEAVDAILDGLAWLGLDWDADVISQFSRAGRHAEVAEEMRARGTAYRCYATKEEIEAAREAARAEGKPPLFRSPWRDRDDGPDEGEFTIRLKAPREGEVVVDDAVQGRVSWSTDQLDDLILLRSDGTPTYMLAVVVDDHDASVTHVIRGDDHLTNAARQTLIYRAMGWEPPTFAHIPLIHGPDGAKLSKRHGALGVEAYREMGFIAPAVRNYLARLGWSHGDDEVFTTEQAITWFGLDACGRSPARFDMDKLTNLNGQHIRMAEDAALMEALDAYFAATGRPAPEGLERERLLAAMPGLKERAKTLAELVETANFIFSNRPLERDAKAEKLLSGDAPALLADLTERLRNASEWTTETLETVVRDFAEERGAKLGKVAQPMRAALTGRAVSPGVFDVLAVLGREESLARLDDAAA